MQALSQNFKWTESLAYLLSYVEDEGELAQLVHELAEELLNKKRDINSAIACYMIAQDHEIVFDLWKKRTLYLIKKGADRNECIFQLFEKSILYRAAVKNFSSKSIVDFDLLITDMAEFLNGEGFKDLAQKYLHIYGDSN